MNSINDGSMPVSWGDVGGTQSDADFGRTFLGQLFGYQGATEKEDWLRSEQSADLALGRDLEKLGAQNAFTASENQKGRDYDERMASTAIQRKVADAQAAGINPIFALGADSGASYHGSAVGGSASGSVSGSSYRGSRQGNGGELIALLAKIVAGAFGLASAKTAPKSAVGKIGF